MYLRLAKQAAKEAFKAVCFVLVGILGGWVLSEILIWGYKHGTFLGIVLIVGIFAGVVRFIYLVIQERGK
jgi:hypothetical protein